MHDRGLKQKDLAEVLEVSLSRVKAMTSGRVKNFTREEIELLAGKLDIRAEWLVTGKGPMLQDDEPQEEFVDRMRAINHGRALLKAMPISDTTQERTGALLTGDPAQDGVLMAEAIRSELQPAPAPALPDIGTVELAVEYVRNREQLEKRKLTAGQFAKAVRLAYQITLEEQTAGFSTGDDIRESIDGSQKGKRSKAT